MTTLSHENCRWRANSAQAKACTAPWRESVAAATRRGENGEQESSTMEGINENMAESFFARVRRGEYGVHHGYRPRYLAVADRRARPRGKAHHRPGPEHLRRGCPKPPRSAQQRPHSWHPHSLATQAGFRPLTPSTVPPTQMALHPRQFNASRQVDGPHRHLPNQASFSRDASMRCTTCSTIASSAWRSLCRCSSGCSGGS